MWPHCVAPSACRQLCLKKKKSKPCEALGTAIRSAYLSDLYLFTCVNWAEPHSMSGTNLLWMTCSRSALSSSCRCSWALLMELHIRCALRGVGPATLGVVSFWIYVCFCQKTCFHRPVNSRGCSSTEGLLFYPPICIWRPCIRPGGCTILSIYWHDFSAPSKDNWLLKCAFWAAGWIHSGLIADASPPFLVG